MGSTGRAALADELRLGGAGAAEATTATDERRLTTTGAAPSLPSAVTEPPRGLLARLFGR